MMPWPLPHNFTNSENIFQAFFVMSSIAPSASGGCECSTQLAMWSMEAQEQPWKKTSGMTHLGYIYAMISAVSGAPPEAVEAIQGVMSRMVNQRSHLHDYVSLLARHLNQIWFPHCNSYKYYSQEL